ncbi:MAG: DUF4240 domain-containing protein [Alphaproteobacteria bacterium]|nr:DUF4240 domain-containing protein [Alphaproteobacteria bacterium]MCB9696472.1 DUF4240 domain-containing protein [Alphaproteobacteria bacterium]
MSNPNEERFWAWIESGWTTASPRVQAARKRLAGNDPDENDADVVSGALPEVIRRLEEEASAVDAPALIALDRQLERKLFDLDRAELQDVTGGSDDGFLYARGFVVVLGRGVWEAVNRDPERAVQDAECADVCYLPQRVYERRFGSYPGTASGLSRESGSNSGGWPEED